MVMKIIFSFKNVFFIFGLFLLSICLVVFFVLVGYLVIVQGVRGWGWVIGYLIMEKVRQVVICNC